MSLGPAALWIADGIQQILRLQAGRQAGGNTQKHANRGNKRKVNELQRGSVLLLLIVPLLASYSCLDAASKRLTAPAK